jgi:hypothetical protein
LGCIEQQDQVKLQSEPRFINKEPMMSKKGLRAIWLCGGVVFAAVATMN